jgi:hypothetical protein
MTQQVRFYGIFGYAILFLKNDHFTRDFYAFRRYNNKAPFFQFLLILKLPLFLEKSAF